MKLRLPSRLFRAVVACMTTMVFSTSAYADVPTGYTQVNITSSSQLASYTSTDYMAFIIGTDIANSSYRMTGEHQYWGDALSKRHDLAFTNFSSDSSGCTLCVNCDFVAENFKQLSFENNSIISDYDVFGGAIYAGNSSSVNLNNNTALIFSENSSYSHKWRSSVSSAGGAIYVGDTLNINNNGSVTLYGNYSRAHIAGSYAFSCSGGAIFAKSLKMSQNKEITVRDNGVRESMCGYGYGYACGGSIYATEIDLSQNGSVSFIGNYVNEDEFWYSPLFTQRGARGGAIYSDQLSIVANESVEFLGNYVAVASGAQEGSLGGAIYCSGGFELSGNAHFRGNYENENGYRQMRSVYVTSTSSAALKLSADGDEIIRFDDSIYCGGGAELNASTTGTIIMSGAHVVEDLGALIPNPETDEYYRDELQDSYTSEIKGATLLKGGTLRVEEGATLKGGGINVAANSGATLQLVNGTLDQAGYNVSVNDGATLDLQGVNSIAANTLDMQAGSLLSFTLSETNLSSAVLALTGIFNQEGKLNIHLAGVETIDTDKQYVLMSMAGGETPATWDAAKVTVSGLTSNLTDLHWENGTLYYTASVIPELLKATWSGTQSGEWNHTDMNWTQGSYSYAFKDGVDVVFDSNGTTKDVAVVESVQAGSVQVQDNYTFTMDTGATLIASSLDISAGTTLTVNGGGCSTFDSLCGTGRVVVGKDSTLTVSGTVAESVVIEAADGAIIDAALAPTQIAITAGGTAKFAQGISDNINSVYMYSEGSVTIENTDDEKLQYSLASENAKVTADHLIVSSQVAVEVDNIVVVSDVTNNGAGALTLTHADTASLETITANGDIYLQLVTSLSLADMYIGDGKTVAVYTDGTGTTEGVVSITEMMKAGGGTLLANLDLVGTDGRITMDLSNEWAPAGWKALTLGSEFTVADNTIITLDDSTLTSIASLENVGDTVILIEQYDGSELTTNLKDGVWARQHFDLSSITDADYKIYVQNGQIGITKCSNVPEPTTGTLSLLALASLCVRKRRK